jgi:DNA adenine methylase
MVKNISPLRYPGGKKKLTNFLAAVISLNNITQGKYIEPFAGGAGAALTLLLMEYVHNIVINDADYNIFCFWQAVINKPETFIKRIKSVKVNLSTWQRQKMILENTQKYDPFDIGFATFFLNRCNRSGILNAGPIGGLQQSGTWKIDARYCKKELIERIEKISYYRDRIKVYNLDAIDFIKLFFKTKKCLFYLDPPYYVGGRRLYLNYYNHDDHVTLSKYIQNEVISPWVLSYDNVPEIAKLYQKKKSLAYDLRYSVNISKTGKEIMFFSDNLKIPNTPKIV